MLYKCTFCGAVFDKAELYDMGFEDLDECPECGELDSFETQEEE